MGLAEEREPGRQHGGQQQADEPAADGTELGPLGADGLAEAVPAVGDGGLIRQQAHARSPALNSTESLVSSMYASSRLARWAETSENGTRAELSSSITRDDGSPVTVSVSVPVMATVAPACVSVVMASVRAVVRSMTIPLDADAMSDATEVSAMTLPRPTTTRWSAVSSTSLIRWLETRMARPCAASPRREPRIQMMPSGSTPLNGSSIIRMAGSPSIGAAMPSRCRMPRE